MASEEQARFLVEHLGDPGQFWTDFPVATIPRDLPRDGFPGDPIPDYGWSNSIFMQILWEMREANNMKEGKVNIVLVIIDTLRQDHVGAYGNEWIITPHLDSFAKESVLFTRCYPESLPTLPVRRALFTGKRVYPFHGHKDYKGDFSGAPGWGPIPEEQDTISEILNEQGYRTSFITDTYHYFKPSKNFHRGFDEWDWIRGQEMDPYKSGPLPDRNKIAGHMVESVDENPALAVFLEKYLTNNNYRMTEQDYYPARVFTAASRWLGENWDTDKFFLVVDSFDPHEPWDPPDYYRRLYDPEDDCINVIQSLYGVWPDKVTPRQLKRLQANYAGEVTMVDRWFGHLFETLRRTGRLDDTVVAVISDHGHNLGIDPGDKSLVSKQGHPLTRAVADLVLMVRHPHKQGAGTKCDRLFYNFDLTTTLLSMAGIKPKQKMEGIDFWPAVTSSGIKPRDHVTIAWGPLVTVIDEKYWFNANVWGEAPLLYSYHEDPFLERNLAADKPGMCKRMLELAVGDAGGKIPEAFKKYKTAPGCTPFVHASP